MNDYLTPEEVAGRLKVSTSTVYRWAKAGKLSSCKVERTVRFMEKDVDAFLRARQGGGADLAASDQRLPPRMRNRLGMSFVLLPAGEFPMGSPWTERGRSINETPHYVSLLRPSYILETPVTSGLWTQLMGGPPSGIRHGDRNRPVVHVNWYDVVEFCNRLSEAEGLEPAYTVWGPFVEFHGADCPGYRLPTEAEWEYACRAGTRSRFSTGELLGPEQAHFGWWKLSGHRPFGIHSEPAAVGSYAPNDWGLFDMHGNVWEWCWDFFGRYDDSSSVDPYGPESGAKRVLRGGCWSSPADQCRSAYRAGEDPGYSNGSIGFRVMRSA